MWYLRKDSMPKKDRKVSKNIVDRTYDAIKKQITLDTFQTKDLFKFTVLAMKLVDEIPNATGPEKKDLVLTLANRIVEDIPGLDEDEVWLLQNSIDLIVPGAIDQIIAGSKGQLGLNASPVQFTSCFGRRRAQPAKRRK